MSEFIFSDREYAIVCDYALSLLRRQPTLELQKSIVRDIDLIEQLCRQSLINEQGVDTPVVVFIPNKIRREIIIAAWRILKQIGYRVRIEDRLGPNGEAKLTFDLYQTSVVTQDAFQTAKFVN